MTSRQIQARVRQLADGLERDRREPDKVLTYVASYRRLATDIEIAEEARAGGGGFPEWCPVCHAYHVAPGEKTDAGGLAHRCPKLPLDDPRNRFEHYPLTTGEESS